MARRRDDFVRNEKDSNFQGAFRVPAMIRWPGHIKENVWSTEIVSGLDWFPTFLAAAGNPNITDQLLKGAGPGGMAHKVHLDGYNILPYLGGKEAHSPRKDFFYFDDERHACGCAPWRLEICLLRTACAWGYEVWSNLPSCLRVPTIYNLRMDPYERAKITSDQYDDWQVHNAYLIAQSQIIAAQFLTTF